VVQVRFYSNMRTITGQSELVIPISSPTTLRELLTRLTELFPDLQNILLNEQGRLYPDVPLFVNGRNPRLAVLGVDMPLGQEDVITLFSPVASGRMNVEGMRSAAVEFQEHKR
jgi:MoaD family protein